MSPFDKARYARLLEGLEACEVFYSEAFNATKTSRIDPEYFNRTAIKALEMIKGDSILGDLALDGYRVVYETTEAIDQDEGKRQGLPYFLQAADITTPFINADSMVCVADADWVRYPKGRIKPGELLIEVKGKAEKIALVPDDFPPKTLVSGTCFKLTTKNKVDHYFLAAYLTCRYGQALKDRLKSNLLVAYIAKDDLYGLPVPKLSYEFKKRIQQHFLNCFDSQKKALCALAMAESMLLRSLGLDTWQPPEALTYVRSSRDAFGAGRLDAEHFQPRFKALMGHIDASGRSGCLGDWLKACQRGKQPNYADAGLPVVNSKHVLRGEVRLDAENRMAAHDSDTLLIEKGDVLINGTGVGTIGRSAAFFHERRAIPDNHVTILRPKANLDSVYLSVFLNSQAGQLQVEQRLRGSSGQIELYPNDIAEFRVWVAPLEVQASIRHSVEQSFTQKQRATQLLDAAKRAVEIAIETDEDTALAYLNQTNEVCHDSKP